jgi:hypothetical protein
LFLLGFATAEDKYHRFCYLDSVARFRPEEGSFTINDFFYDATLCTHLVFIPAEVNAQHLAMTPVIPDEFGWSSVNYV